jgi:hypothetical protein
MRDTANNGSNLTIVRMVTTDPIETVITPGWLAAQKESISLVDQNGNFQFTADDLILLRYGNQDDIPSAQYLFYVSQDLQSILPMNYTYPYNYPIAAHPGFVQSTATQLKIGSNVVSTVASNTDSVKLPLDVLGQSVVVFNNTSNTLGIFPSPGDQIDIFGVDVGTLINAHGRRLFVGITANSWASFD